MMYRRLRLADRAPRGVTLLELLVTIGIILAITAAVIPVMAPAMAGRRLREASRGVNTFISSARNRAMVTGRPVGVAFERLPAEPQASMLLSMVEVPAPWSGDNATSTIEIGLNGQILRFPQGDIGWQIARIRPGDILKLNYRNTPYRLVGGTDVTDDILGHFDLDPSDPNTNWSFVYDDPRMSLLPPRVPPGNYPFQILRQPVKSASVSYQLPVGTIVDLAVSGDDSFSQSRFAWADNTTPPDKRPVVLLFAANGAVDRIWQPDPSDLDKLKFLTFRPTAGIQLLVGRRDGVGVGPNNVLATPPDELPNWRDLDNLWVTVNAQTGMIASNPNAQVDTDLNVRTSEETTNDDNLDPTNLAIGISQARAFARQGQSMGGK